MIKVYGRNNCGACMTVKVFLEGNGLVDGEHFVYINTDEEGNEEHKQYLYDNYTSVPITEYKDYVINGFDLEPLEEVVELVKA